ncbi:CDGSH iron-sulfur domain-containing protein 2B-like isoform X1 [Lytechinus pictus]|uniref:CDGSH iron-sulfur domain-containing protein 2B-like isoform X1 n=1 Tax=Lytechinus pictus TaxID=7653 RepID=UPI0030B9E6C5
MEAIAIFFKVTLPSYFETLPIPETFGGFLQLTGADWLRMVPLIGTLGAVIVLTVMQIRKAKGCGQVNPSIEKDKDKVVHSFDIEDLGDKAAFCRCWRSKAFPKCDGSHNMHNKLTGDNVGPLCLSRKSASS